MLGRQPRHNQLMLAASMLTNLAECSSNRTVTEVCVSFVQGFPQLTLLPNNTGYSSINEGYFSAEEWLGPACIFTPDSPQSMATAVQILAQSGGQFAVRGGGWMPILGAANIDSNGILLATTNLTGLQLADDRKSISVASGHNWADIYNYLSPDGLAVVGSRIGVVGVPGFMLGGGMSFLGNQYGWASGNVVGYEAVLSSGSIVYATSTNEYSDLFWALRGGGNNFAIVTRFDLKTYEIEKVAVGNVAYGSGQRDSFLADLYDFSRNGVQNQRAFVLPTISYVPAAGPNVTYSATLFYNDNNETSPSVLQQFLPPQVIPKTSTFATRTLADWSAEADQGFDQLAQERGPEIKGFISTLAMNPVSRSFIETNRGADPAGDPMGIDSDAGPYFMCEQTFSWSLNNDTGAIETLIADINSEMSTKLGDKMVPFLYLNNPGSGQDVFNTYNAANLQRLKTIKAKYDNGGVYTSLLVGGFKL
ncbi:Bifunctional solanapyrone synthase [Colletotrichum aenigma]|uniref:Bifunctional solanapyrone synthase n=1 Tax=Colletotrichum aenigma TaxID=1215731 RepID=UPI0018733519|nr:Bifunctional solanapyrone synthase [Colletotrichum aenigma]KAF5523465.1 Bifunctional solanapyrone synthase [Colletotrichum aenigma]